MFSKKNRLRKERDIKRVFSKGKHFGSSLFSLLYLENGKNHTRVTVVVSKKYDKRAVYRNKLKRKFREAAYHLILSLKVSADIIILPKSVSEKSSFQEVQGELEGILKKTEKRIVKK